MKKIYSFSTAFLALLLFGVNVHATVDPPEIVLIQPDVAGIVWTIDESYLISWTDNFSEPVDIYYQKGSAGWVQIADDVPSSTWTWNTATNPGGLVAGTDYKVKIVKSDDSNVEAISSNDFEFTSSPSGGTYIHVLQPNVSGIEWEFGTTRLISWEDYLIEPVTIDLYKGGVLVADADAGLTSATNITGTTWSWTIPASGGNLAAGTDYKIRITSTASGTTYDESDNNFSIVGATNGGTYVDLIQPDDATGLVWEKGTTHLISWMDDCFEGIKLSLLEEDGSGGWQAYTGGGTTGLESATNVSGTTYSWAISTDIPVGDYKIKAESSVTGTINDISTNSFEIVTELTGGTYINLIQPNVAGLQWVQDNTYLISWMDDVFEGLIIKLYYEDPVTPGSYIEYPGGTAASGLPASAVEGTTYSWTIPAALPSDDYKIYLESSVTSTLNEISANTFEVTSTPSGGTYIDVLQPDVAGLVWRYGETHLISWMDDLIENVEIELWKIGTPDVEITPADCGLSSASSLEGTTWSWEIPASGTGGGTLVNGDYKIKIKSTDPASSVEGWSENTFEITDVPPTGEIVVIQPNGGEQWIKGNHYLISWNDNISEPVKVEVTSDASAGSPTWYELAASVVGTTWVWETDNNWPFGGTTTGTDFKVRISTTSTTSLTSPDLSDAAFEFVTTLGGTVEVIQPNGGEVWLHETTYLISWNDELIENVHIELWDYTVPATPVLVPHTISGLPDNTGAGVVGTTHIWYIPTIGTNPATDLIAKDTYRIRVYSVLDGTYQDVSDADFEITDVNSGGSFVEVLQPNGGEEVLRDWPYLVSWNDDIIENVYIKLYKNGVLVDAATSGLPTYGSGDPGVAGSTYNWNVPAAITLGTDYKIRVESIYDNTLDDYSDADFSIIDSQSGGSFITVIQPNGGEEVLRGSPYLISWNDDVIENVDIELWDYSGAPALVPAATSGLPATGGAGVPGSTYQWNVPSGLATGTDYRIRVFSSTSSLEDFSDAVFEIIAAQTGGTYIDIIQPNGGETWINGNAYWLSWMDDVFENVDIELYKYDAGDNFLDNYAVASDVVGTTHVWTIDNTAIGLTNTTAMGTGDYFKLYVASTVTPGSLNDFSNDYFTISNSKSPQTGLNLANDNTNVYMYPNPANNQVSIASIGVISNIEITNLLGQQMFNGELNTKTTEIDVSGFEAGIYVVNLTIEGEIVVKKLFIK